TIEITGISGSGTSFSQLITWSGLKLRESERPSVEGSALAARGPLKIFTTLLPDRCVADAASPPASSPATLCAAPQSRPDAPGGRPLHMPEETRWLRWRPYLRVSAMLRATANAAAQRPGPRDR